MLEQKIILAQNTADTIENLIESEKELDALNQELDSLTQEYAANMTHTEISFFNIANPYLWFVIGGLMIVSFALIFLIIELKKPRKPKERIDKIKFDSNKEVKIENIRRVEHDYEAEEKAKKKPKGPVKIKVLKIK